MGWFREDSPIEIYEDHLISAVKNGNTEQLSVLLQTRLDVPAAVFNKALNKAVREDKIKTVEILVNNRTTQWSVDVPLLRDIVNKGNEAMFRVLHKAGWAFDNVLYSGENSASCNKELRLQVALWKKEIACEKLEQKLQELKAEITEKVGKGSEIKKYDPCSAKKDSSGHTL